MHRKIWKAIAFVFGAVALVLGAAVAYATRVVERSYARVPYPEIAADRSAEGVARGELLFHSLCLECHRGRDGRATGQRLAEVPAFLGTFHSANLAHPRSGVHARSDRELARVLRFGVLPDGRLSPVMSNFGALGDADVAALLGYMRSGAAVFEPGGEVQPRSRLSLAGALIMTFASGGIDLERPVSGVEVPKREPSVEYGRYMVQVLDCVNCHTQGYSSDKLAHPEAFAGGFEFVDPTGTKIWSKNITMDEATGIGRWSLDDFDRALRQGITPDGQLVRKPMPLFSRLERVEVEAIAAYLRSRPPVHRPNTPGGHPVERPRREDSADALFVKLGCSACHGETAPHRDALRAAAGKPDADVAAWILDPQAFKAGSTMPSFRHAIDRAQAERLARYVKELASRPGG